MTKTKTGLRVVRVQRSCVHDGPGLRTTIFFRGCALRCRWCQNPESLDPAARKGDENLTAEGTAELVLRDAKYYRATGGGVTLSGGEPFLQDPDSLLELLEALEEEDIPVAAETSLCAPWEAIEALVPHIGLFVVDLKAIDGALHKELAGRDNKLILSNLEKLAELGAHIRLRMLVVPGLNDSAEQIKAMADYVKSLGFDAIELMRYHSMYEDKARQLGLEVPMLGITGEQSLRALKNGIELFKQNGLDVRSDDLAQKPPAARFSQRVLDIQTAIREAPRSICFEVSQLKTEYYKKFDGFSKPVHIHRAERLRHVLRNKKTIVYPGELLVGNFTGKRVAGQIWEEQYGALYALFIGKADRQTPVKFYSTRRERMSYYLNVFPYWLPKGTIFRGGGGLKNIFLTLSRVAETSTGFNNNFAAIAHFVVNFERVLKLGTLGLKAEAEAKMKERPENNQDFYRGVLICLQALEDWAQRYAAHLNKMAVEEAGPARKAELEKMAKICARVPKYPARTFHEALQSMMFLQLALCIEAYENAVSFGRLDQILYPYFKHDLEEGRITCDEAKELLCLFVLKMDEVILVNDGDGVLNVSKLFETLSVDQALTFGGVDREGNDAVNDVTYMCIDACELQPLAINMCARIHEKNPRKYLDRLAEIYINGCPMPELFGDEVYIESLRRHYPDTTLENARDYAIVGCVEPIASDDHFGNTDSANMNLALPLLQAMKGHEYDLWTFPFGMQMEKMTTRMIEFFLPKLKEKREKAVDKRNHKRGMYEYDPPEDMDELLARFKARLNALARSVLADQQIIEQALSEYFTTPLASSLYKGCMETGRDAYEGGTHYNTAGIQAVGVTDAADSLHAIDELVFRQKKYSMLEVLWAMDANFEGGSKNRKIREDIMAIPKFGDDSSPRPAEWVTLVMKIFNEALEQCPYAVRDGNYTAGYYALNTADRYGIKTQALPSGRLKGTPLANSVAPAYAMEKADLLSSLNSLTQANFTDYAANGTTATFTIDAALFPGEEGVKNLGQIFKTFFTSGGMQFQPNIVSRGMLQDAYDHPEKYKYLMVRVAGYCAYFNELSDDLKKVIINRTCYG